VKAGDGSKAGEGGVLVADFFYGISCQASLLPASPPLPPFWQLAGGCVKK